MAAGRQLEHHGPDPGLHRRADRHGKLYLPSEDGTVFVVKAGPAFEVLSRNPIGERIMASPALSDGTLYIRGEHHLFAIAAKK